MPRSHAVPTVVSAIVALLLGPLVLGACGAPELGLGTTSGDTTGDTTGDDTGDPAGDDGHGAPWLEAESRTLAGRAGLSPIGILSPHFDCDALLAAFGDGPIVFGYLERTFGNDRRCLDRLLDHPRFSAVRVHVFNGPCVRNQRCGDYEVLRGESTGSLDRKLASGDAALLGRMRAELVRVRDLLGPHLRHGKRYYVSGILEHDVKSSAGARRMVALTREVFGRAGFKVVNSPVSGARHTGADLIEGHGDRPDVNPACIVDLDGTEVSDIAAWGNRYRACDLILAWNSEMNCLADGEGWLDPRRRTHCPTRASLASFARWLDAQ